ncbi:MAG: PAS domain-containing protein [Methylococcales bacterium]|nr:PAS domain-containing protein [Methylococcales bacterium]
MTEKLDQTVSFTPQPSLLNLYECAPIGFAVIHQDGCLLNANRTLKQLLLGIDAQATLINQLFSDYVIASDQSVLHLWQQAIIDTGEIQSCELRLRNQTGHAFWVKCDGLLNTNAAKVEIHIAITTIEQFKKTDRELEQKTQQLAAQQQQLEIVSLLPGIIYQFLLRPDGSSCFPFISDFRHEHYCLNPDALREDASSLITLIHPDDLADLKQSIQISAEDMMPWNHECRMQLNGNSMTWVSGHSIPQREADGSILWHGFLCDITIRKQLERELEQQRIFLRQVIDTIPALICVQNLGGVYSLANKAIEEAFGTPSMFVEGQSSCAFCQAITEDNTPFNKNNAVINNDKPFGMTEKQVTFADGSRHWLRTLKVPLLEDDGTYTNLMHIGIDITKQKQLTEQVLQAKQCLDLALEGGDMGMWDWHISTGTAVVSVQWCNILGYEPEEILPSIDSWKKIVHKDDLNVINTALERHIKKELPYYMASCRLQHKNGQWLWILTRGKIVEWDAEGKPVRMAGTYLDITQQKKTERQRREFTQHQNAVMEAEKTRIAQEIHDEFGSILTSLKIDLSWLNKKLPKNLSDFQKKIYKMTLRLEQAIQAVRNIATQLRPSILDHLGLFAAIDWQFTEFKKLTDITCSISLPDADLNIDTQKSTAIFRILQTALTNIALHAKATEATLTIEMDEDNLILTLTDNGCGIAPAQMQQTGKFGILGMHERANSFNGHITLSSQLQKGTTLVLTMPIHSTEQRNHDD